jgi:hypothetical protein
MIRIDILEVTKVLRGALKRINFHGFFILIGNTSKKELDVQNWSILKKSNISVSNRN